MFNMQLSHSLGVMQRVIFALVIRESRTRYGSANLGYLWALLEPLIELIVLALIFALFGRISPVAASMPLFLATGILPYHYWRNSITRTAKAITSNIPLLTYPQVKPADVVVSRWILETATTVSVAIIFVVLLYVFNFEPFEGWIDEPLNFAFSLLMLGYFGLCFSFFSTNVSRIFSAWSDLFSYMSRPLWFISGIFFTLHSLPPAVQEYALWNPIAHQIEWIRSSALSGFDSDVYDPFFIFQSGLVVLAIGLAIDRILALTGHTDQS